MQPFLFDRREVARRLAASSPVAVLEPPLDIGRFTLSMIWHERRQDDPAHAWLRRQMVEAARQAMRD